MFVASGNNKDGGRGRRIKFSRKELADKRALACLRGNDSLGLNGNGRCILALSLREKLVLGHPTSTLGQNFIVQRNPFK